MIAARRSGINSIRPGSNGARVAAVGSAESREGQAVRVLDRT